MKSRFLTRAMLNWFCYLLFMNSICQHLRKMTLNCSQEAVDITVWCTAHAKSWGEWHWTVHKKQLTWGLFGALACQQLESMVWSVHNKHLCILSLVHNPTARCHVVHRSWPLRPCTCILHNLRMTFFVHKCFDHLAWHFYDLGGKC